MFDMTNGSHLFLGIEALTKQGFRRDENNHWQRESSQAVPLYEGKMVQAFDHRAAAVVVNLGNLKHAAQQEALASHDKQAPGRLPAPPYWVRRDDIPTASAFAYCIEYKSVTAPSNMRTMIAALLPASGVGNSMAMLIPEDAQDASDVRWGSLLLANINAFAYDFLLRQKVQGQNLNWFIVEQSCVIAPTRFDEPLPAAFAIHMRQTGLMNGHHAQPTVADFVVPQVLAPSYSAHDLAPFARDLGYVDAQGEVLPPITWNDADRRARMAALDATFFHLYGLGEDDADYILSTFPIVRQQDIAAFGHYRTRDDVLALLRLMPPLMPPLTSP